MPVKCCTSFYSYLAATSRIIILPIFAITTDVTSPSRPLIYNICIRNLCFSISDLSQRHHPASSIQLSPPLRLAYDTHHLRLYQQSAKPPTLTLNHALPIPDPSSPSSPPLLPPPPPPNRRRLMPPPNRTPLPTQLPLAARPLEPLSKLLVLHQRPRVARHFGVEVLPHRVRGVHVARACKIDLISSTALAEVCGRQRWTGCEDSPG